MYLKLNFLIILLFLFSFSISGKSFSKGDLTKQIPIEVEVVLKGKVGEAHFYDPSVLKFETGKLYKLKLRNIIKLPFFKKPNSNLNIDKIINVGILGCGWAGASAHGPALDRIKNVNIVLYNNY